MPVICLCYCTFGLCFSFKEFLFPLVKYLDTYMCPPDMYSTCVSLPRDWINVRLWKTIIENDFFNILRSKIKGIYFIHNSPLILHYHIESIEDEKCSLFMWSSSRRQVFIRLNVQHLVLFITVMVGSLWFLQRRWIAHARHRPLY